jgi:hypothetical protein
MSESGNIVLLDWMTCGRTALDEEWLFTRYIISIFKELVKFSYYFGSPHWLNFGIRNPVNFLFTVINDRN